jgi:glucosamine kinase
MRDFILAMEGGGSKTRILLADDTGHIVAEERCGSSSPLYIDICPYAQCRRHLFDHLKHTLEDRDGRLVRMGLAGPMPTELVNRLAVEVFGPVECRRYSEGAIALALHGLQIGVSLVAGTGSSCRAVNESGEWVSLGGIGPQFGDEGSGYWIGREAVSAAVRAAEGRAPATALCERLLCFFQIHHITEILNFLCGNGHISVPRVAQFTSEVVAAARDGDRVALQILAEAGHALGDLVLAAARSSGIALRPVPLALTGGVFHARELVRDPMLATLHASGIQFEVMPEVFEPIRGLLALLLAPETEEKFQR